MVLTENFVNSRVKMEQRTGVKRDIDRVETAQEQSDQPEKRSRNSNENYSTIQLAGSLRYTDQVRILFIFYAKR
jgi:hypothetical protein